MYLCVKTLFKMDILPSIDIESTLCRLFPWIAKNQSGASENEVSACEQRLGISLPKELRSLYLKAGKDETVMSSFNNFARLDELFLKENKLIFIEENQGACYWAVSLDSENPQVYMHLEESNEWIAEKMNLAQFISLLIYNQCIFIGYEHCGIIGISGSELYQILESDWEKVVDYNGLHIYWQENALIWSLEFGEEEDIENDIYFSTFSDEIYYLNEVQYQLTQI